MLYTNSMDITLIAIAFFLLLAIAFLILFLLKSFNKKTYKADDGTVFDIQSHFETYQILYDKTRSLFLSDDENSNIKTSLGFEATFLNKIIKNAFPDLKTLVKYRKQIKLLSDLINT